MSDPARSWDVLLVGGASGVGKTSISRQLARYFDLPMGEVDDYVVILKQMTTPEQQPILHYWDTHAEGMEWTAEKIVELTISVIQVMAPGIEAVIDNHLEGNAPVLLEGDYLLPSLVQHDKRVRGVFLYEPDERQIVANYLQREPDEDEQTGRARVSWLLGEWFKTEAEKAGALALTARPWETLLDRIVEGLGE